MPFSPQPGGSANYGTPRHLFDFLNRRFQFDYDAFADHGWRMPTRFYSTPDGTFDGRVAKNGRGHRLSRLDGFDYEWTGRRVYFNPPYKPTGTIARAVDKAVLERASAEIIVAILPVDTSAHWWHVLTHFAHLEPLEGRPAFIDHETGLARPGSTVPIVVAQFYPGPTDWKKHAPPMPPRPRKAKASP